MTAQEIFEETFRNNNGVVELAQLEHAIKSAGNVDSTVIWRMWHNKRSLRLRGNYLVSQFLSETQVDAIISERTKPATQSVKQSHSSVIPMLHKWLKTLGPRSRDNILDYLQARGVKPQTAVRRFNHAVAKNIITRTDDGRFGAC